MDWSACGEAEQEYLSELFESMQELLGYLCEWREMEKEDGCDVSAATDCFLELANAFILPGISPCS